MVANAPGGENGLKAMLWLGAMLVSLPMLIASVRKLEAMGMLISEVSVTREAAGESADAYRAIVRNTVFVIGCMGFLFMILMLSSTILPSWRALLASAFVVVLAVLLLRKSFSRIYSKAQAALHETFAQPPDPHHSEPAPVIPPMMRDAKLKTVVLEENSPVVGKLIGEIKLRTKCGASVVGIERPNEENVINPGSDEELKTGDRVLLLGSDAQLNSAEVLMTTPAAES
jgi:CPA2 family monovalent cation:H+ antiporter-2